MKTEERKAAPAASPSSNVKARAPSSKHSLLLVLHGKRADDLDVRDAVCALRAEGQEVEVAVTWESADAEKFVCAAAKRNRPITVVSAGGDGTITEVVDAIIGCHAQDRLSVGVLPLGTSNDFAAVVGLPEDAASALRLCCSKDTLHSVDVGRLNGKVFMNTATIGAGSEIGSSTSHDIKTALGPAAFLVTGAQNVMGYHPVECTLRFPAEGQDPEKPRHRQKVTEVRMPLLNLTAGNSRQLASILQVCPDSMLDDGLLDITYIEGGLGMAVADVTSEILAGTLEESKGPSGLKTMRVPWLEVECTEKMEGNTDGDSFEPTDKFFFEALPRVVRMHLPDNTRVLKGGGSSSAIQHDRRKPGLLSKMLNVTKYKRQRIKQQVSSIQGWMQLLKHSWVLILGVAIGIALSSQLGLATKLPWGKHGSKISQLPWQPTV